MSDLSLYFTEQEFHKYSRFLNASSIDFEGDSFNKGVTFSLKMQEQAIKYCQKLAAKKIKSLSIKSKYGITIWIQTEGDEDKETKPKLHLLNEEKAIEQSHTESNKITSSDLEKFNSLPKNLTNEVSTKKVTRVYRGQTYEVEIPDYSAIQKRSSRQKPRRKYRGQYVD